MFYSRFLRVLLILPFVRASLCVSSVSEGRGVTDDCVRVCVRVCVTPTLSVWIITASLQLTNQSRRGMLTCFEKHTLPSKSNINVSFLLESDQMTFTWLLYIQVILG